MKKFITSVPQQPAGQLHRQHYEPVDNMRLDYAGETRFPVIPLISGYAEPGEEIRVFAITPDYENCRSNLAFLEEELSALCAEKELLCPKGVERIDVPFDESVETHIATFQKLIDTTEDNDILYACITFGSKPTPLVETMALQYAHRIHENASIGCVAYGQVDRSVSPGRMRLFDVTALLQLQEIVQVMAENGVKNPRGALEFILGK